MFIKNKDDNMSKLKLFALGSVWFVLGGVYSLTAYAVGQYAAQLF